MNILRLTFMFVLMASISHQAHAAPKAQSGGGIIGDLFKAPDGLEGCFEVMMPLAECLCAVLNLCIPDDPPKLTCEDECFRLCYKLKSECRRLSLPSELCDQWTAKGDDSCLARCKNRNCPDSSTDSPPSP